VTTVAADGTDIGAVAAISADVQAVADIAADVSAVAAIDSDVTTAAANVADITNFSDVYQGPKSSDPATRNDTTALQAGDLYFNTTDDAMKVYDGAAWQVALCLRWWLPSVCQQPLGPGQCCHCRHQPRRHDGGCSGLHGCRRSGCTAGPGP
jgi:hypothetical protein